MSETNRPSLPVPSQRLLVAAVILVILFAGVSISEAGKKRRKRKSAQIDQAAQKADFDNEKAADRDQRLATLVARFNGMMDEQRFAEAEVLAKMAQDIASDHPIVATMLSKVKFCQQLVTGKAAVSYEDLPFDDRSFAEPRRLVRFADIPCEAHSPPSDKHVMQVLEEATIVKPGDIAALYENHPENIRIDKERISHHTEQPRHVPLLGPVQLHRETYKCTVHLTNAKNIGWPVAQVDKENVVHVVYVDQTHIHSVDDSLIAEAAIVPPKRHALLDLISPEFRLKIAMNRRVSMDFDKVPLKNVIEHLATATDTNIHLDERSLHAEGITTDQPISIKLSHQVKLRIALQLILAPLGLDFSIADEVIKVTSAQSIDDHVYAVVYNVADLVLPIPATVKIPNEQPLQMAAPLAKATAENLRPSYDALAELLTTTIAPESWDNSGGPAAAGAFPTNLSLVVSQTEENHRQIAELLEQLRRLQKARLTISVDTFQVSPAGIKEIFADRWSDGQPIALNSVAASSLKLAMAQSGQVRKSSSPRVTVYNGQGLDIPVSFGQQGDGLGRRLLLLSRVADNRRSISIRASIGNDMVAAMANQQAGDLKDTGSLLFDFTDSVKQSNQLSLLPLAKDAIDGDRLIIMISAEVVTDTNKEKTLIPAR